jgi:hypothetical protein
VLSDDIENKLEEWAMRWLKKFKPFTNFFRSLNIIGYEIEAYYDKLFGDVIMEALLTNRTLNCQLISRQTSSFMVGLLHYVGLRR